MNDKDPVVIAEQERDLPPRPPSNDEDTEYGQWVEMRRLEDKSAVLDVFKKMHIDTIEETVDQIVILIDKARCGR